MRQTLIIENIAIEVQHKRMKNIRLRVLPPDGLVKLSAPYHFTLDAIRLLLLDKLDWIRQQQQNMAAQPKPKSYQYVSGEQHSFQGQSYRLHVIPNAKRTSVALEAANTLCLYASPKLSQQGRQAALEAWYRAQLMQQLAALVPKWAQKMRVPLPEYRTKKMKTRWGTCNIGAKRIWLNLELIKTPPECLEYVVVHELTHLLERNHSKRFHALMTQFMPAWKQHQKVLNETPLAATTS